MHSMTTWPSNLDMLETSPRLETGWAKCVSDFRAQAEEVYLAAQDGEVTVRRVDGYPAIQPGKFFEATRKKSGNHHWKGV